jgi:hypothetical protein
MVFWSLVVFFSVSSPSFCSTKGGRKILELILEMELLREVEGKGG